ncbi:hypothetical protein CEXT_128921 [Caerostris extrusa]|uniref:Uncharacterized protein n=1 Tax=Caerostris extrusa TaxID=172846 RepID=A0AAV4NRC7_CAEEX|nr:hypothetical protein CEXT_128921 [Caerostris extrusa]
MGDDYPEIELLIGSDIYGQIPYRKSFYMHFMSTTASLVDTNVELEVFIQQATAIMADAKMELRMWTFGPEQELSLQNVEPISPVLGLQWDHIEDSLFIPFKLSQ